MCALIAALSLSLVGCSAGGNATPPKARATPTLAARQHTTVTRPALLIQFCNDDTGSYPREDFAGANQLMADGLQQAVTANQHGAILFATAITHNTFDPVNTLNPTFTVPSIEAYPAEPTPVPTHDAANPVTDPATATAVSNQTLSGVTSYNAAVAAIDKKIADAQKTLRSDLGRLTSWNPPLDTKATSVLGCFQLAASRFQGQSGERLIYVASDMENNTDVDYTANLVTSHALAGAIVHVIYFYSKDAAHAAAKRSQWCPFLQAAGAKNVLFSDPATPLTNTFDADLAAKTQTC